MSPRSNSSVSHAFKVDSIQFGLLMFDTQNLEGMAFPVVHVSSFVINCLTPFLQNGKVLLVMGLLDLYHVETAGLSSTK